MPAMVSPLRAATAMLRRHSPAALCLEFDLTSELLVAGATRAVAGGEGLALVAPIIDSFEISAPSPYAAPDLTSSRFTFPAISSIGKIVQGFHTIPVPEIINEAVPRLSASLTQNSHRFLVGGIVGTGMFLLAEASSEKCEDVLAGQTADVVELLRQQLEKSSQLEAENTKLKQEASSKDRQLTHDLQIEITRQAHKETMERLLLEKQRMKTDENKGGDGDKGSGDGKKPGDEQNSNKNKKTENNKSADEKEPLYKQIYRFFMAPATAATIVGGAYASYVKWTTVFGFFTICWGCTRSEWIRVSKGEFEILDPRNEFPETRSCPCGLSWPECCGKCGRRLIDFVPDAGLIGAAALGKEGTPTGAASAFVKKGQAT